MFALTVIYNNHSYDLRNEVLDHSVYYAAGYTLRQVNDLLRNVAAAHHSAQDTSTPGNAETQDRDPLGDNLQILREVYDDLVRTAAVHDIAKML